MVVLALLPVAAVLLLLLLFAAMAAWPLWNLLFFQKNLKEEHWEPTKTLKVHMAWDDYAPLVDFFAELVDGVLRGEGGYDVVKVV